MFNKKMILSIIIVLVALLAILYNSPEVAGFFSSVTRPLGIDTPVTSNVFRNVSFYLESDKYNNIDFTLNDANISILASQINGSLFGGEINANNFMELTGFTGTGSILDGSIILSGAATGVNFAGGNFVAETEVDINAVYDLVEIRNLALRDFNLVGISGKLNSDALELTLSNEDVDIRDPKGRFVFSDGLAIDGIANKITAGKIILES